MTIEHRAIRGAQIRAVTEDGQHFIDLQIITPNVVDDYGSVWMEDCFDRSLDERMPTLAWAHDWSEPIGRGVSWSREPARARWCGSGSTTSMRCRRRGGRSPRCSRARSMTVRSGSRTPPAGTRPVMRWASVAGVREVIESADDDEVSLVLRGGAGAKVVAYRSGERPSPSRSTPSRELARRVNAGELTEEDALTALDLLGVDDGGEDDTHDDDGGAQGDADGRGPRRARGRS